MAKGGKRAGAGRKKGKALKLTDLLKQTDIDTFLEFLLANYMEDSRLMIWMGDHIFGKAPQPIAGDPDNPLTLQITGMTISKDK